MTITTRRRPADRRGAILLVVLVLLTLFAVVGLSFAVYGESEAGSARLHRETGDDPGTIDRTGGSGPAGLWEDIPPVVNLFLSQLVYDVPDYSGTTMTAEEKALLRSGVRGHSLARSRYGYDSYRTTNGHLTAYAGTGPIVETIAPGGLTVQRSQVLNHGFMNRDSTGTSPSRSWTTDYDLIPERAGFRNGDPSAGYSATIPANGMTPGTTGAYTATPGAYVNKAAPYTSPDLNNAFLAVADPVTGQVVAPSYHRTWLFNGGIGGAATTANLPVGQRLAPPMVDPNTGIAVSAAGAQNDWVSPVGRLRIARPRPEDHRWPLTGPGQTVTFPYPSMNPDGTFTGDVQNLKWANGPQRNDSVWLDLGSPTFQYKGKTLVPLVAPLILDLNSRVNLNTAAAPPTDAAGRPLADTAGKALYRSSMGLGPVETNPLRVMGYTGPNSAATYPRNGTDLNQTVATGVATSTPPLPSRNGRVAFPAATMPPAVAPFGVRDRYQPTTAAAPQVPGTVYKFNGGRLPPQYSGTDVNADAGTVASGGKLTLPTAPTQPPFPTYPTAGYDTNTTAAYPVPERVNHPLLYNPAQWKATRGVTAPEPAGTLTDPHAFGPNDVISLFARPSRTFRSNKGTEVTGLVADPATTPQMNNLTGFNGPNEWTGASAVPPQANANPYMSANFARMALTTYSQTVTRPSIQIRSGTNLTTDFVRLGPVDLNRPLPDLRKLPDQSYGFTGGGMTDNQLDPTPGATVDYAKYAQARQARQNLARDIFVRLAAQAYYDNDSDPTTAPVEVVDGVSVWYVKDQTPAPGGLPGDSAVRPGYLYIDQALFTAASPAPRYFQLNALRRCAQMAANMVDYIDGDDTMTAFVWNPVTPLFADPVAMAAVNAAPPPPALPITQFIDPSADPLNYWDATSTSQFANRVVYGTELPRISLSETYATIANDRTNLTTPPTVMMPAQNFKVKFWVELTNPLGQALDPVLEENGAARLQALPVAPVSNPVAVAYSAYLVDLVEQATPAPPGGPQTFAEVLAQNPGNVTGDTDLAATIVPGVWGVRARLNDFADKTTGLPTLISPGGAPPVMPDPNNFLVRPIAAGATPPNNGFFTLAGNDAFPGDQPPPVGPPGTAVAGDVQTTARMPDPPAVAGPTPPNALILDAGTNQLSMLMVRSYTVVLRRLADPHRVPNYPGQEMQFPGLPMYMPTLPPNPYITVDLMDRVVPSDRVTYDQTGPRGTASANPAQPSRGKRHPFAAEYNTLADQTGAGAVPNTFFANNTPTPTHPTAGTGELAWLPQADRELISPAEMLHASAVPPYELTSQFGYHDPAWTDLNALRTNNHTMAPMLTGALLRAPSVAHPDDRLSRVFDLLTVRSRLPGTPVGGAESGRINLNTVWDDDPVTANNATMGVGSRVLAAVLNPRDDLDPTYRNPNTFDETTVRNVWGSATPGSEKGILGYARTLKDDPTNNRWVGRTAVEWNAADAGYSATAGDRPFWGSSMATAGTVSYETAPQTIFRLPAVPGNSGTPFTQSDDPAGAGPAPLMYNARTSTNPPVATAPTHPYLTTEPVRKMLNSVSTTSDSFLVLFTVTYFEVRGFDTRTWTDGSTYTRPVLGKEAFDRVPGDLRVQYATIVDRSMLTVEDVNSLNAMQRPGSDKPTFTGMAADAQVGDTTIDVQGDVSTNTATGFYRDETDAQLLWRWTKNGGRLRIGYGDSTTPPPAAPAPTPIPDGGDGEWVTTSNPTVITTASGEKIVRLQLAAPLTRAHPAGSSVSNVLLGNPGPQTRFDPARPPFRGVFPLAQPGATGSAPLAVVRLDPKDQ